MKKEKLRELCLKVIKENPLAIEDYKEGNKKVLFFLVGTVIKEGDKSILPASAGDILQELIEEKSVVGERE